jgi:hypothetical protein
MKQSFEVRRLFLHGGNRDSAVGTETRLRANEQGSSLQFSASQISFLGVKWSEHKVDHLPPSSAEGKNG